MKLFKNLNFSFLLFGRLITNIGDSLYFIAATWLAYSLGGSAFYSGLAGFLTLLPEMFNFLIGPIVDRSNLKKVLLVSEIMQFLLILLVPTLYLFHQLNVTWILILMPLITIFNMFSYPAEISLVPKIVEKKNLVKANSAMSFAYQGTELIFNGLGGILVLLIGAVSLYVIDSATFLISIFLFASLRLQHQPSKPKTKQTIADSFRQYQDELKQGFKFALNPIIINMLLPLIIVNFTISAATTIFPAFADHFGGAATYGILMTCFLAGLTIGSLLSQFVSTHFTIGRAMIIAYGLSGILWMLTAFGASSTVYVSFLCLLLSGIPVGATNVIYSSLYQLIPPENMIARVQSLSRSFTLAAMPLGALAGGYFASLYGSGLIIACNGFTILLLSCYWLCNPKLRTLPKVKKLENRAHMDELIGIKQTETIFAEENVIK
ncbi:MAG TPA: MFS transporter [Bacillales bacterium]|nr:MFS transporter [Bacillales bacterium]